MKTFDERTNDVMSKIQTQKNKQRQVKAAVALSLCVCLVVAAAIYLFAPYDTSPPDVSMYEGSDYFALIQQLNKHTYKPPQHKNNYEYLISRLEEAKDVLYGPVVEDELMEMPGMDASNQGESVGTGSYVETTDNQVQGVTEADLIKRSDSHIYYLRNTELSVYSIAGADSKATDTYHITFGNSSWVSSAEMYLSEDCSTVTLVLCGFGDEIKQGKKETFVCIVSLDVTDPTDVKEVNRQYITGRYLSSRKVDGTFLVMSRHHIDENALDFDDMTTYLPQIGVPGNMVCVGAEDIISPDTLTYMGYTTVTMISEKGLVVKDAAAYLSYGDQLYVSDNCIYLTSGYTEQVDENVSKTVTEISGLSYAGGKLEHKGSIVLDGRVNNQYYMDEHKGVLRVVTSTSVTTSKEYSYRDYAYRVIVSTERNANLYCVNLSDWTVAAKVEAFAPGGESAESVRFDGDTAYVCTAEVITMTDPVYYFDLSDLGNITWKDTGTIDGYSSSLANFGDYLLGIGYNEFRELKIEIYRETQTGVESLCKFEMPASFSEEYKSYLIDRERQLIGLGVIDHSDGTHRYILLGFDGVAFETLAKEELAGSPEKMRSVLIDGWLYLFGEVNFKTVRVW